MKRTNVFKVIFENPEEVIHRTNGCTETWNKLNYRRRQSFFNGEIDWTWQDIYDEFKGLVGSATVQLVVRKNTAAWNQFFTLLKLKKNNHPHIRKVRPPGY